MPIGSVDGANCKKFRMGWDGFAGAVVDSPLLNCDLCSFQAEQSFFLSGATDLHKIPIETDL
jgi:hypothetical protein